MADFILHMPLRFFARVFGNPAGDPVLLKSRGVTLLRDSQKCRTVAGKRTVTQEDLGTRLSCFGCETKMAEQSAEHFTHFTTNYCLKT